MKMEMNKSRIVIYVFAVESSLGGGINEN